MSTIQVALRTLRERITTVAASHNIKPIPELIAVSKTKPAAAVQLAYAEGQRAFGENYVVELVEKAAELPGDIRWHFIGHLQSNKAKVLAKVPNLYMVESVDNEKLASALDKACAKSGCEPKDAVSLWNFILHKCAHLHPAGLMTIGRLAPTPQPDCFRTLQSCRADIQAEVGQGRGEEERFEMSMGMSGDWELAVAEGSTMVRLGSSIFGERDYGNKSGEKEDKNASEAKTGDGEQVHGETNDADEPTNDNKSKQT